MATFGDELERARELAQRLRDLDGQRGGLEFDEDHGGPLGPTSRVHLERVRSEQADLCDKLRAFFARAEATHQAAFRAYLGESAERLRVLAGSKDGDRFAAGDALYTWDRWLKREETENIAMCFAKGEHVLKKNGKTIDALLKQQKG